MRDGRRRPLRGRGMKSLGHVDIVTGLAASSSPMQRIPVCPALVSLFIVASAAAQGVDFFSPKSHLEGFEKANYSDYRSLYDLEPFLERSGSKLSAKELAEIRARWAEERAKAEAEIQRIESDPRAMEIYKIRRKLDTHPYFMRVALELYEGYPPHVFFVQKATGAVADDARTVASRLQPWLVAMEAVFQETWGDPNGLQRNEAFALPIAVLPTPGDYQNFGKATRQDMSMIRAHYDPELRLAVTYEDPFAQGNSTIDKLGAMVHEFTHALQHAYSQNGEMPRAMWLNEGMADYHSNVTNSVESLRNPTVDGDKLKVFLSHVRSPAARPLANSATDLLGYDREKGYGGVIEAAARRLGQPASNRLAGPALSVFYAQSALFVHFLMAGQDGRYRQGFVRYVGKVLRGEKTTFADLQVELAGIDPGALDREFQEFCAAEYERLNPGQTIGDPVALIANSGETVELPEGAVPGAEPLQDPGVGFPCTALAPPASWRVDAVRIFDALAERRFAEARAGLEAWGPPDDEVPKAAQSLLEDAGEFFENALARMRSRRVPVSVRTGGKAGGKAGRVLSFTEATVTLDLTDGPTELPLDAISFGQMAKYADEARFLNTKTASAALVLMELAGEDPKARALAMGKVESSKSRMAALEETLAFLARVRQETGPEPILDALATMPEPKDVGAARAGLRRIETLLSEHGQHAMVAERRDTLRGLCQELLVRSVDRLHPPGLAVETVREKNGVAEWSWEFEREADAPFPIEEPPEGAVGAVARLIGTNVSPRSSSLVASEGALEAVGGFYAPIPLELSPPFTIEYEIVYEEVGLFMVGFSASRDRTCGVDYAAGVMVMDPESSIAGWVSTDLEVLMLGESHTVKVEHDGSKVTSWVDGKKSPPADRIGACKEGGMFLLVQADGTIKLESLRISGKAPESVSDAKRNQWVRSELERIFGAG